MNPKFIQTKYAVVACALCCAPMLSAQGNAPATSGEATASAGATSVSGEVLDANGDPLTGVSVGIQGKGIVGITDIDGRFNVKSLCRPDPRIYLHRLRQDCRESNRPASHRHYERRVSESF